MMRPIPRRLYILAVLVLGAVIFGGLNVALDAAVTGASLDLTENGRFTLSDGTVNTIRSLKEPVRLRFFYSKKIAADYPQTRAYAERVRDLLHRYIAIGGGKIVLEEIDPEAYSPEEDEANRLGLSPAPTESGEQVYFGLAGSNSIDGREAIAYFSPEREAYLEYDLTQLIYRLANPDKPKLAILSSLPLSAGRGGMQAMLQGGARPFAIYRELARNYDIDMLAPDFAAIPQASKVLLIVQPGALSEAQLFAIDQFVMKGGRVVALVDPDCELVGGGSPMAPPAPSDMKRLFKAWGVGFDAGREILDLKLAQKVQTSNDPSGPVALYPLWLHAAKENFSASDPVTAALQSVNLASAGALYPLKSATTDFTALIRSSDSAGLIDVATAKTMGMRPEALAGAFTPEDRELAIAARIQGPADSAFAQGAPADIQTAPVKHADKINLIVIADSDLIDERFWVRSSALFGGRIEAAFADNGALIANAIENLMGSDDLISLRTRSAGVRPFTLVKELQADAEGRYRQEAESLRARLSQAQERLNALQKGEGGKAGELTPTPAQAKDVERFKREVMQTRIALREVQRNLRKDIDTLGAILAFFNIAAVPLAVIGFAVFWSWRRRRRAQRG